MINIDGWMEVYNTHSVFKFAVDQNKRILKEKLLAKRDMIHAIDLAEYILEEEKKKGG